MWTRVREALIEHTENGWDQQINALFICYVPQIAKWQECLFGYLLHCYGYVNSSKRKQSFRCAPTPPRNSTIIYI